MTRGLIFVALGNSLTVGHVPYRREKYPYTRFLKELVYGYLEEIKRDCDAKFVNRGINGDLTRGMLLRLKKAVIDLNPDHLIILGGSNDVGWGFPVEEIFLNLKRMYNESEENNIDPIGCTIPSILGWDDGISPRLKLNGLIKDYCCEKEIPCADLFEATRAHGSNRLKAEYSSDGLHLNPSGYKKIAETIFQEAVKDLISREALNAS